MSLQTKVISLILSVFLAYGALDYGVQHLFILPSFLSLEKEEALKNMDRAAQAIEQKIQNLVVSATDWSVWDDTYQFVQDQNEAFRQATLNNQALESLKVNLLYFFNTARQPIWGKMYDLNKKEEIVLPELLKQLMADPLIYMTAPESEVKGFLVTELGTMLIVAKPILTSNGEGPVHGTLLLGRFLNTNSIAEQTLINLKTIALKDDPIEPENATILAELGGAGKIIIRNDQKVDRVYQVLNDLLGKPALLLRVDVPNTISARGKTAIRFAMLSLFGAGLAILGVLIIGLRRMMLAPLRLLTAHAVSVGQSDNLSARLDLHRRDELGRLAMEFDRMVERLAEASKALIDQSYHSGVAEMASGVLHNIGNAMTPLSVKLSNIKELFRQAPVSAMDMAVTELADPATPADRRADLSRFLELAAVELADVIKRADGDRNDISKHVDHIQMILADQQRFSRAQRVIETLDISALVAETVDLLPEPVRKSIKIEAALNLKEISKVKSSRIALQQVLSNILINSSESIFEKHLNGFTGHILIYASEEAPDGSPMAHLCIEDNGIGIPPDKLSKIFDRGFSTKARGSGMGLHWSANTVAALKGRLYAENKGEGVGAAFHLLLPMADVSTGKKEGSL
jgi:two-component system, NtrC family, sensor kinase